MTLAEARALTGSGESLIVRSQDTDADRAALESLAVWADRFSPCVHLEGDDTLLLDMSGCERLFPDEENLLRRIKEGLDVMGYTVRAALADTPGAAWAMVHAHPLDSIVAPPGRTVAALAPLPVGALRIDERTVDALRRLGVETIEALLHLPRSSLAARFDDELLLRLDQALGDVPELLTPFRARPVLRSHLRIARPTEEYDVLREGLERVLAAFCEQLERRVAGVRQLFVTFELATDQPRRPVTFEVHASQATRAREHLRSLLLAGLGDLRLPAGAIGVMLWARRVEPLDGRQEELFDTGLSDAENLAHLVDRLVAHLGAEAVVRPQPRSDHQPERAYRYVPLVDRRRPTVDAGSRDAGSEATDQDCPVPDSRPLRVLPLPVEVTVVAIAPEGPPSCFDWQGSREEVVACVGPERVETGWWRGRHIRRDYFRATCRSGRRCWLFRQRGAKRWFLHGWFD